MSRLQLFWMAQYSDVCRQLLSAHRIKPRPGLPRSPRLCPRRGFDHVALMWPPWRAHRPKAWERHRKGLQAPEAEINDQRLHRITVSLGQ